MCLFSSAGTQLFGVGVCVNHVVYVYIASTKAVLSAGSLRSDAFVSSLSAKVHTRCCDVQSLCSPSTDTQSCLIKLLDQ